VKIDALVRSADLSRIGELARQAEGQGFDSLFVTENRHDPFLALALAAEQTGGIAVGTCVASALPRSPMHLAQVAHDLQTFFGGRLTLGLGIGDRVDLEDRFGVASHEAAARMRELVLAVRAIWQAWNDGAPLRFEGRYYRHTLMPPAFDPGPTGWGPPRIVLLVEEAGLAEIAGEVADGVVVAGSPEGAFLRDVVVPAVARGLHRSDRDRSEIELSVALDGPPGSADELHEYVDGHYGGLADRMVVPLC